MVLRRQLSMVVVLLLPREGRILENVEKLVEWWEAQWGIRGFLELPK